MKKVATSRCVGETKFFKQCPRTVLGASPAFCWEHAPQERVRTEEYRALAHAAHDEPVEWRPMGFTNIERRAGNATDRLQTLASDEQNVHTPEVQGGVSAAIRALHRWAAANKIRTEHDLVQKITGWCSSTTCGPSSARQAALDHLRSCYSFSDDTLMFGVTYPMLASWVWARVIRATEHRDLLLQRFFEEVRDSAGQCLNGNMSRLMNVFAALDKDLSPQESADVLSREALPHLISRVVDDASLDLSHIMNEVQALLQRANVPSEEWGIWIDAVIEARE